MMKTLFRLKSAKSLLCELIACAFLCGCVHYDVTLQNGTVIRTKSKPKLDREGCYVFKDISGKTNRIKSIHIRQIEPAHAGSKPSFYIKE